MSAHIFTSARHGYRPSAVRNLMKVARGPVIKVPGSLMAYLNSDNPKRGPYRPRGGGKSKRHIR